MRTIDWYMDEAMRRQALRSERQLSMALGLKGGAANFWRQRKAWPSAATMVRLADLAGVSAEEALLELNIWREQDVAARNVYSHMLAKLTGVAASLLLFLGILTPDQANASVRTVNELTSVRPELYIMRQMELFERPSPSQDRRAQDGSEDGL